MANSPDYQAVESTLLWARRLIVLCRIAQAIVAAGMIMLSLQCVGAAVWYYAHPASFSGYPSVLPFVLLVSVAASAVTATVFAMQARRLTQVAKKAEASLPQLGLRLTTSIESQRMPYCPASIRGALYRDTLDCIDSSPWHRFASRSSALVWVLLALLLLGAQVAVDVPVALRMRSTGDRASGQPASPAATQPATRPLEPILFHASLDLLVPAADMWATKIESIPVKARATSSHGLEHVRLMVSIGGAEPLAIAMPPEKLASGRAVLATELYLDELPLQDYDMVACNVAAEAVKPDGTMATVESGLVFVQIRPFRKDVLYQTGGGGSNKKRVFMVRWLLEQEKKVVRSTGILRSSASGDTPAARSAIAAAMELQQAVIEKTLALANGNLPEAADDIGPVEQATLLAAADLMRNGLNELTARRSEQAMPKFQQATALLGQLLRNEKEIKPRDSKAAAGAPPQRVGPKEPPAPEAKRLSELQGLAEAQEHLNAAVEGLTQNKAALSDKEYQQEIEDLTAKQRAITETTAKIIGGSGYSQPIISILAQAKGLTEENTAQLQATFSDTAAGTLAAPTTKETR